MGRILIIGAGDVASVIAQYMSESPEIFEEIIIASRSKAACKEIVAQLGQKNIRAEQIDANQIPQLIDLIARNKPDLVINAAPPTLCLPIMEACLETEVSYLDTSTYKSKDEQKYEYKWQWAYQNRFKQTGITAILGCGFNPGITGIFTSNAAKHYFDEIHHLDIVTASVDSENSPTSPVCNKETEKLIRESRGKYWEDGEWMTTAPLSVSRQIKYPNIGSINSYLVYHEELESLVKNFPTIKRARFWTTLNNSSSKTMSTGETSLGCRIKGIKDGVEATYYIFNNCTHTMTNRFLNANIISYTTGIPAAIGAKLFLQQKWRCDGVFNVEEFDSDPFMVELTKEGFNWHQLHNIDLQV